jgi:hypothetical protein
LKNIFDKSEHELIGDSAHWFLFGYLPAVQYEKQKPVGLESGGYCGLAGVSSQSLSNSGSRLEACCRTPLGPQRRTQPSSDGFREGFLDQRFRVCFKTFGRAPKATIS